MFTKRSNTSTNTSMVRILTTRMSMIPPSHRELDTLIITGTSRSLTRITITRTRIIGTVTDLRLDLESLCDGIPLDVGEERVDVLWRGGAVVDLESVFVHVHHENGRGVSRMCAVIGHPVVLQNFQPRVEPQYDPTRSATQSLANLAEFRLP